MSFSNTSETILDITAFIKDSSNEIFSWKQSLAPIKGSGWALLSCVKLHLKSKKYNALNAGSCIELQKAIDNKNPVLILKIVMIIVLYILLDVLLIFIIKKDLNNPKSVKQYQKCINDKKFSEIDFQMSSDNIPKFENKSLKIYQGYPSMSIDEYILNGKCKILPLRISKITEHIHLEID